MIVGYNVDGDPTHHIVEVETDDVNEAVEAVQGMLKEEGIEARRVLAMIQGGKTAATAPVLELPPNLA